MNTQTNAMQGTRLDAPETPPAAISSTRLMYWSLRRELWENRSIYLAPLIAGAIFLFGFLISLTRLPARMRAASLDPAQQQRLIAAPYEMAAALIMGIAFIVGVFYALDALYGERRDRSILFWKSLPVSDLTAVLAKVSVPLFFIPLLSFAIAVVTQWVMLLASSIVLLASGVGVAPLWTQSSPFHLSGMLLYHIVTVHGLWYAPLYGWLLLVSAWAPRAPFLWAFLPPFVIWGVEKMAFNTSHFLSWLQYRLIGPEPAGMAAPDNMMSAISALTLGQFLSTPGLWMGLAVAAAFLAAAVRLRRYRGPV